MDDEGKAMKRKEMLDATEPIFEKAGFRISLRCRSRPSCFDFVARRKNQLVLMKAHVNIGSVSAEDASELKSISKWFSAASIFLGFKARDKPLEDDTVYSRYDIYTITPRTMEDVFLRQKLPLVEAGPGGYYISLDGDLIRKRREELGLSVGKMAGMMGISRRTLYGYEKGITKASVSTAYKLAWILGVPMAQPVNVFKPKSEQAESGFFAAAKHMITHHLCLQKVVEKFTKSRLKIARTKRAPFDFIAHFPDEQLNVIGGVADEGEKSVDQRAEEILSVSEVVGAQAVFITDGEIAPNGIPLIRREELEKMQHPKDFIAKI